jgi:hypothetical protein
MLLLVELLAAFTYAAPPIAPLRFEPRGLGPFLFPEQFVQSAAPPRLVHVRGTHRGLASSLHPSASPLFLVEIVHLPHARVLLTA